MIPDGGDFANIFLEN